MLHLAIVCVHVVGFYMPLAFLILIMSVFDGLFLVQTGQVSVCDARYAALLRQAVTASLLVHAHPRALVSVTIHVEADAGALLACAFNAASLALLDAGVPMQQTIAAAACVLHANGPRPLLLDPLQKESEVSSERFRGSCRGPVCFITAGEGVRVASFALYFCMMPIRPHALVLID